MELKFRKLRADEIDVRLSTLSEKGATLLLYKDARVDQTLLDEVVGPLNWQKKYDLIDGQLFCTIMIWDPDKQMWISKQDVGVESNAEAEKGRASDAQKRAAFAFGIGRELYTAPFIFVPIEYLNITKDRNGKNKCYDKFRVSEIDYDGDKISYVRILNDKTGAEVWSSDRSKTKKAQERKKAGYNARITEEQVNVLREEMIAKNVPESVVCKQYGIDKIEDLPADFFANCCARLRATVAA